MQKFSKRNDIIFSQHFTNPNCVSGMSNAAVKLLQDLSNPSRRDLVYLCIGTDRATGDCLGPLVGNKLSTLLPSAHVYGTLEQPLHALNLESTLQSIDRNYAYPLLIAIDAGLGQADRVGFLTIRKGSLSPGLALNKKLPPVGDIHIIGTVNVSGFCEHLILQNTRLFIVYKMAEILARALFLAHHRYTISLREQSFSKTISAEPH
ncbi:MAG: spore protease YyaC [Syntrophomonadaceae bacterium]|jgi:putative sporulation protein YyaC|nr:spore protease YyaC [Syntrophomonadaceae bacterium]